MLLNIIPYIKPNWHRLGENVMLHHDGMILWLTGLPASGKTTVASLVSERLKDLGARVQLLDGDVIRALNNGKIGFSREERIKHVTHVGTVAQSMKDRGIICIVAMIAPYAELRKSVFDSIGVIEIFVDAPLEVCQTRDPKGLYAMAVKGKIKNFTGMDDPYEPPGTPHIHLHTDLESPEESCDKVYAYLCLYGRIVPASMDMVRYLKTGL
jgi:adenylyl-sulfate kinase